MTQQSAEQLKDEMRALGFPESALSLVDYYREMSIPDFNIQHIERENDEKMFYDLEFRTSETGKCILQQYNASYRPPIDIPDMVVDSVNLRSLDKSMGEIDWSYDQHMLSIVEERMQSKEGVRIMDKVDGTLKELDSLMVGSREGISFGKLLMYKHWTTGYYFQFVPDYEKMKMRYELSRSVINVGKGTPTASETYTILKHQAAQQTDLHKENYLVNLKTTFMNQKNSDYLRDQVKFTGFGEGLENELQEKMQKQTPEFQIAHKTKFGNDDVSSVLHFKKSDQTDMYFFNRYEVSLKPEQSKDEMVQTFYINKGNNITLKEAYNLMNGRAVNKDLTNKEDQVYNAWLQLDYKQTDTHGNYKLKQFHENYGYDLNAAIQKHPIKELSNEQDKTRLEESLQKGNRQSVTFMQNGSEQKHFIEANPQFKTINIFDSNMQRMSTKQRQDEKQGQGERQSSKQSPNGNDGDDSDGIPKASKNRRRKQSNSSIN